MDAKTKEAKVVRRVFGAGRWFPGNETALRRMVTGFIEQAQVKKVEGKIVAAISPHAGYVYSGKISGYVFRAIQDGVKQGYQPETVVVLGFSHSKAFRGVALMDGDAIMTPLGEAVLDKEAAALLVKDRPMIRMDYTPHRGEHSAENQIPFVQVALPKASLVVALVGDHEPETLKALTGALDELAAKKKILVLASSDMLHDPDYDFVSKGDRETLKDVAAMKIDALRKGWNPNRQNFCGISTVLAAMMLAKEQGCREGSVLFYRNNGDDDPSSRGQWVVGYGAVVFTVPGK